jgi:hypothetical protein
MSPREKKFLIFFGLAAFIILNFIGFSYLQAKRIQVTQSKQQANQKLNAAKVIRASRDQVTDQMEWLAKHEPKPAANQDVQTALQQFVELQAKSFGLTIKNQKPLPTDTTGKYYQRAKIQFIVTGSEESLYRWFDSINVPDQLRIVTQLLISPNPQDDTKVDCTATFDQWFVSQSST